MYMFIAYVVWLIATVSTMGFATARNRRYCVGHTNTKPWNKSLLHYATIASGVVTILSAITFVGLYAYGL